MIRACTHKDPAQRPSAAAVGDLFAEALKKLQKTPKFSEHPQLLLARQKAVPVKSEAPALLRRARSQSVL